MYALMIKKIGAHLGAPHQLGNNVINNDALEERRRMYEARPA